MAKDLNQCNFIGRLGKDPEIRFTPNGNAVANLNIACSDDYKDKQTGQTINATNWIRLVAFNRTAEIISEYCKKGSQIFVTGKQVTRKWQDNNGKDQYTTEVHIDRLQLLGSRSSGGNAEQGGGNKAPAPPPADDLNDDIPF